MPPSVSVIIPTLWKSSRLEMQINAFLNWEHCEEVVILDNDPSESRPVPNNEKISIIRHTENRYVNPSWNIGAAEATGDFLLIANDDVSFDPSLLSNLLSSVRKNEIIGCHEKCFTSELDRDHFDVESKPWTYMNQGWGCVMLLHRSSYTQIPESMLIYCGDDWLSCILKPRKMLLHVDSEMSTTSGRSEFNLIKDRDIEIFKSTYRGSIIWKSLTKAHRLGILKPLRWMLNRQPQ